MDEKSSTITLTIQWRQNMSDIVLALVDEGYTVSVSKVDKKWPNSGVDHYDISFDITGISANNEK